MNEFDPFKTEYYEKYQLFYDFNQFFESHKIRKVNPSCSVSDRKNETTFYREAMEEPILESFCKAKLNLDGLMTDVMNGEFENQWSAITTIHQQSLFDELLMPIFWYRLVHEIGPDSNMLKELMLGNHLSDAEKKLYYWASVGGVPIIKLYIVLVHHRDFILKYLNHCEIQRQQYSSIDKLKIFLNCDYIRIIRNSLAHGSFQNFSGGIMFIDRNKKAFASPLILDMLPNCLNIIALLMAG